MVCAILSTVCSSIFYCKTICIFVSVYILFSGDKYYFTHTHTHTHTHIYIYIYIHTYILLVDVSSGYHIILYYIIYYIACIVSCYIILYCVCCIVSYCIVLGACLSVFRPSGCEPFLERGLI